MGGKTGSTGGPCSGHQWCGASGSSVGWSTLFAVVTSLFRQISLIVSFRPFVAPLSCPFFCKGVVVSAEDVMDSLVLDGGSLLSHCVAFVEHLLAAATLETVVKQRLGAITRLATLLL